MALLRNRFEVRREASEAMAASAVSRTWRFSENWMMPRSEETSASVARGSAAFRAAEMSSGSCDSFAN